jgi:hypothetical protein
VSENNESETKEAVHKNYRAEVVGSPSVGRGVLDWIGLDWTGLDWTGLDTMRQPSIRHGNLDVPSYRHLCISINITLVLWMSLSCYIPHAIVHLLAHPAEQTAMVN